MLSILVAFVQVINAIVGIMYTTDFVQIVEQHHGYMAVAWVIDQMGMLCMLVLYLL